MRLIGFAVVVFVAVQLIEEMGWINDACRMGKARWDQLGYPSLLYRRVKYKRNVSTETGRMYITSVSLR